MSCHAVAKNGIQNHYHTFVWSTALHIYCTSSRPLCYTQQPAFAASILTPLVSYGTRTSSSAAGKTTLLNALAGQVPLTKGMSLRGSVTANGVSLQVGLETCMQLGTEHLLPHTMHKFGMSHAYLFCCSPRVAHNPDQDLVHAPVLPRQCAGVAEVSLDSSNSKADAVWGSLPHQLNGPIRD